MSSHSSLLPAETHHGAQGRAQGQQEPAGAEPRVRHPEPCRHSVLRGYGVRAGPHVSGSSPGVVVVVVVGVSVVVFSVVAYLLYCLLVFTY